MMVITAWEGTYSKEVKGGELFKALVLTVITLVGRSPLRTETFFP